MDIIVCQYCNTEVSLAEVEKEGGACPECGAMISGTSLFGGPRDDDYEEEEDFELDDSDSDYGDDDDDDDDDY